MAKIVEDQTAGRSPSRLSAGEESPGSTATRRRVTPAGGDPRDSATESKPPLRFGVEARVKGWGKSPPRTGQPGRHGKPRLEQDRIGMSRGFRAAGRRWPRRPGRSREPLGNGRSRGMIVASTGRPGGGTEPGLQAVWSILPSVTGTEPVQPRSWVMPLDTTDIGTPAAALVALKGLVPTIQASSAQLDREGAFPTDALDLLAGAGVLAAFGGPQAAAFELMEALRLVGRANLSLGRVFEGHCNTARLIDWYGTEDQKRTLSHELASGHVFGVWNTETAPVTIADGELRGFKTFATGAGHIDTVIVTATVAGARQMVLIDAAQSARCDPKSWPVSGMKATVSGTYDLSGLPASGAALLGEPGDYEREPRFSAGAWRFTAVQLGGIERILGLLRDHLVSTPSGDNPIHRARFAEVLAQTRSAGLWVREAARRATREDAGAQEIALVLMTRGVVERAGLAVMEAAHRSIGTRSYFTDGPVDMACRDLGLYLRQPAPDQALDRAASAFLAADCWREDPLW